MIVYLFNITETCFSRHGSAFDANQFTNAMQRFFAGSGDKNGGLEKRKNKSKDKIQGKESEKDSGKGCDGGTSGAQRKRKEAFESSSGEESNINSKDSSRKTTSSKKSFFSSSSDCGDSESSVRSGYRTQSCESD